MSEESIVKPQPFKDFRRKHVLYIPSDSPSRNLQKLIKKSAQKEKNFVSGKLYLLKDKVVLYQSTGAPLAVLALERLIASGTREIILLGFCGSLNRTHKTKDVVSISKALSEEGTARHYFPRKRIFYSSPLLKKRIESSLHSQTLPFLTGSVVSTDAPYRETKPWLKQKQRRKIDCVDMETSAVFALAEFHGIQAAALLIVSDELWSGDWKKEFHTPGLKEKTTQYFVPFL